MYDYSRPRNVLAVWQVQNAGHGDKNAVAKEEVDIYILYIILYTIYREMREGEVGGGGAKQASCNVEF